MTPKPTLYLVSTWDHQKQRWCAYVTRTRKWGLRKTLRSLRRYGYSDISILVERRDGDTSGMRWPRRKGAVPPEPTILKFPAKANVSTEP